VAGPVGCSGTVISKVDAERARALAAYEVLGGEPRKDLSALVELASRVSGIPMATINLITESHQHQVATWGFPSSICERRDSMCARVIESGSELVMLSDAREDERFVDNAHVNGELASVRFYAAQPLVTPSDVIIGTLCLYDVEAHEVDPDLAHLMETLASQVVDVLELGLTTRELETANARLAQANERLGAFAGQVSHDLKNPLSAITMSLEMALDEMVPGEGMVVSLLDRAARGAERMDAMIADLLAFAQGRQPQFEDVDTTEVVKAALEDLDGSLAGRSVEVGDLPVVCGDPVHLRVVMQNLIANAVKFSSEGSQVTVSAETRRGSYRLKVVDQGPGVPPEDRERVFEPMVRLDKAKPGTGIGLATCRRIIEAHGGQIGMADNPGGGTIVWFDLPV
jgi:signal transduction histidine kinase